MDETAGRLVSHACSLKFEDLPAQVVWNAKARLLDSIGCALAAYDAPPVVIARRLAFPLHASHGAARVLGSLSSTAPDAAAFANTMMIRYLDFNDAYRNVDGSHPSDPIGGLLAAAEIGHASPRELIAAVVAAYDIQCSFADSVPMNNMGWDHSIPEVIACALGCGRLMRLSEPQLAEALSLAVSPNLATHQRHVGQLSMWKAGYAAMAARQGMFAALMAREGMTGPADPIEGENGLWAQIGWQKRPLRPLSGHGADFGVMLTNIKRWPVRDSCQLPIDAALDLRAKAAGRPMRSVQVTTYASAYRGREHEPELWEPQTRETADHSMPFLVCVALLDGAVNLKTFDARRFLDDDVRDLMGRTSVQADPAFSAQAPATRNCRIRVELEGGDWVESHLVRPSRPDLAQGKSEPAIEEKFFELVEPRLGAKQARRLADAIWHIEGADGVARVIELTAIRAEQ